MGVALTACVLDNETLKDSTNGFEEEKITYQLVIYYKCRNNQAEHTIQTFKSNFVVIDPNFSLSK